MTGSGAALPGKGLPEDGASFGPGSPEGNPQEGQRGQATVQATASEVGLRRGCPRDRMACGFGADERGQELQDGTDFGKGVRVRVPYAEGGCGT